MLLLLVDSNLVKVYSKIHILYLFTNHKFLFVVSPYEERESHRENFNYVERKVKEAGFDFLDVI